VSWTGREAGGGEAAGSDSLVSRRTRVRLGASAVVMAGSVAFLFGALTRPPDPGASVMPDEASQVAPRYVQFCSSCHGMNGRGYGTSAYDAARQEFVGELKAHRPADLTCPGVGASTPEQIAQVVRRGIVCKEHGQVMPAFPDLTDAQFAEIVEQVKAFAGTHGGGEGHQDHGMSGHDMDHGPETRHPLP
jgi:mono/diheme cytochrome c family protein